MVFSKRDRFFIFLEILHEMYLQDTEGTARKSYRKVFRINWDTENSWKDWSLNLINHHGKMNTSSKYLTNTYSIPEVKVPISYKDLYNFSWVFTLHLTHTTMPVGTSKDVIRKKVLPVINIFYLAEECF